MKKRWDIFCKIVDNFGDIGVCWRLARQLQLEHGLYIRLWIDDLRVAQALIPSLVVDKNVQICDEIILLKWDDAADFGEAAEVVIEAFSCELPPAYLAAMVQQKSQWINLEYLSAEPWVADFHSKPSPQANGLTRYFYFPGFTENTGGLIRERNIEAESQTTIEATIESTIKISLFCYQNAPIHDLFTALQANNHAVSVYVPESSILPQIADFFDAETIGVGDNLSRDNLHVHILPFLSQMDYDQLLRDCDINFVRGEDSWVRAIWAAKTFIWQPYLQTENTHIKKLKAFIDVYYANYQQKEVLWKAHEYWAAEHALQNDFKLIWQNYMNALSSTQLYTKVQSKKLAAQPDLAAKLVDFCNKL